MQKMTILGNLCADPELRTVVTSGGQATVCDFTIAAQNTKNDEPLFVRCSAWRGLADVIHKWARKGAKVYCDGPVRIRLYATKDGATRASVELTVDHFEFCGRGQGNEPRQESAQAPATASADEPASSGAFTEVDDQLPF